MRRAVDFERYWQILAWSDWGAHITTHTIEKFRRVG